MDDTQLLELTAQIVASYVGRNPVAAGDLPDLIRSVHQALGVPQEPEPEPGPPQPTAAQIRKSITPDALISFIDGKSYKQLKRHLGIHGLKPAEYRERYGLPKDYPMVAATYSARRSALAKMAGLGRKPGQKTAGGRARSKG